MPSSFATGPGERDRPDGCRDGRGRRHRATTPPFTAAFATALLTAALAAVGDARAEGLDPPADPLAWSLLATPGAQPSRAIGRASLGCLAGAATLPLQGPGWQVMRPSRNRNHGHPATIAFILEFAADADRRGGGLLIGDIAQPRGGPMSSGHRSHQTGLDVDIWFTPAPPVLLSPAERETMPANSMLLSGSAWPDPAQWGEWQDWLLQRAALDPRVDRIFVNPAIKRALCGAAAGEPWLRRLRPWWGHDAHMHVRLACPVGDAACVGDPPLPEGDGCDASLDWWFSAESEAERTRKSAPPTAREEMPAACLTVLHGG